MALFDFLYGQQQPIGGLVGRLQQPQTQTQRGITGDPDFAQSLTRLGANLMAAGAQTDNTLGAIGTALGATLDQNMQARRQQAEINALQARAAPDMAQATPFGGTGYQNQILASRYQFHMANGDSDLVARQKAINDFYALNPVTGVNAEGQPYTMPRAALPFELGGGAAPSTPASMPAATPAAQPDPIDQTAAALGLPTGTLLPPPSGVGAGGNIPATPRISVPQMGGEKTQQALREEAGKVQIGLQADEVKKIQEKQSLLPKAASSLQSAVNDIDRTISTIDSILPKVGAGTAGLGGAVFGMIPGTPATDVEAALRTVKASTAFNALQEMRNNSPTGGALGSIAVPELELLQNSLAAVEQGQSPEALRQNLLKVRQEYQKMRDRAVNAFQQDFSRVLTPEAMPQLPQAPAAIARPKSKADFDSLPSGSTFVDPQGNVRVKP